jgi:hypothetical protein
LRWTFEKSRIIGAAEGSIIAVIITVHIASVDRNSAAPHALRWGIDACWSRAEASVADEPPACFFGHQGKRGTSSGASSMTSTAGGGPELDAEAGIGGWAGDRRSQAQEIALSRRIAAIVGPRSLAGVPTADG